MNLAILAFATSLAAAEPATYPGRQGGLRVAVPRLEETIQVDGALDDAAWGRAAHLLEFSQYSPVDGRPANEATEVLVFYSPAAIHFGVRAHATPGSVRATLANRDRIDAEDSVTFLLSTFNDGRQAVMFSVNPLGVQADGTVVEQTRGRGEGFGSLSSERETADLSPDFVFDSKGRLTDAGYEVELRIPFESLRYQKAEVQTWGLHVLRRSQSTGHEDSWAPAKRAASSFLSQAGTLEGLRELRPGLVLDLNPVLTAKADGGRSPSGWDYETGAPEPGGNVRWGVTPNLTLNGTVNPDFSQVEADAGQFVFDPRQAVFFPEKRPFFLDGLEQFTTPNRLIYTRRIAAPVGAVKLTGKAAGTNLGLLAAVDDRASSSAGDDHPLFAVARIQKDLGGQSRAGLVFTDRAENGGRNTVGGLDTRIVFGGVYDLALQGAFSRTRPGGGAADTAPLWEGVFARNGRRFGFRHQITGIHEDFRAQSGFIGRPGIVRANLDHRVSFFGAKGALLEAFHTDLVLDGIWRYRDFVGPGGIQDKKLHFNNNATLRGGWKAGASVLVESFGYDPDLYEGYALEGDTPGEILPFVGVPRLPNLDWVLTVNTPEWKRFSGYAFVLWGRDENFFEWASADIVYATLRADWRPTEQLRFDVEYQLQQFERRTDHSLVGRRQIPRLKVEYQLTRAIFLRFVGEYDAQRQDDLRDASRTERPILIRNADGVHERALASRDNRFRVDVLFSYQPTPGTVFFAGYGSTLDEPEELRFRNLTRRSDGFFVKISYLFRL